MSNYMLSIEGKVVIVTGGGKGIGRVYCRELAKAGCKVVAADIDDDANAETVAEIRDAGGNAIAATTDVSDEAATSEMAAKTVEAFGRIDGLINNASLMSVLERRDWHLIPIDEWDRVQEVNMRGVFLCSKAVYPQMKENGGGSIINISSDLGLISPDQRIYKTRNKRHP